MLKQFFDISTGFRFSKLRWGSVPSIPVAVLALGDKSNNENPFDEIKGMDKDQMEFTIISQRDIIKNMETELSMYKKAIT